MFALSVGSVDSAKLTTWGAQVEPGLEEPACRQRKVLPGLPRSTELHFGYGDQAREVCALIAG